MFCQAYRKKLSQPQVIMWTKVTIPTKWWIRIAIPTMSWMKVTISTLIHLWKVFKKMVRFIHSGWLAGVSRGPNPIKKNIG